MADVLQAEVPGAKPEDYVTIHLAHRLTGDDLARLGIDSDADAPAGTPIAVYREHARGIISSGYAQVDPEDQEAVRKALARPDEDTDSDTPRSGPTPGEGSASDVEPADTVAQPLVEGGDPAAEEPVGDSEGGKASKSSRATRAGATGI